MSRTNNSSEQVKKSYVSKLSMRDSSKGANLSNAAIIGMVNLYGVETITVHVPKRSKRDLTGLNIKIIETSITGNVDIYTIPNMPPMDNPKDPKEKRRRETSLQAYFTNSMIEFIGKNDSGIQMAMRKRRKTEKTLKQIKLNQIDPFNEKGFELFGEGVMNILEGIANGMIEGNIVSKDGRGTKIMLQGCHPKIWELYCQLLEQDELLTENGKIEKITMTSTTPTTGMENEQIILQEEITSQTNQTCFVHKYK